MWVYAFLVLAGCAARAPSPHAAPPVEQPAAPPVESPAEAVRIVTADGAFDCAANYDQNDSCDGSEGCIWTHTDGCRPTENVCEAVVPVTANYTSRYWLSGNDEWPTGGIPTFVSGDPCTAVDPQCAFDVNKGICEVFEPVAECPATLDEAAETTVFCMHPDQPELLCGYAGAQYYCGKRWHPSGGIEQPPGTYDDPKSWLEWPDYDHQGCPMSERARQASCEPLSTPNGDCVTMDVRYRCPDGTWEWERLPPRP